MKQRIFHIFKKGKYFLLGIMLILGVWYYFSLPKTLFNDPTSTVITSRNSELLGAQIAKDGQWRFPEVDSLPNKFSTCVLYFEDEYFYHHPGFNPISIAKAIWQNWKTKKIVRGGSTITQQVIRLSRKGKRRTVIEKLKEMILSTRLELRYSKDEILKLYASHAPFGGNVVGIEAAAWRYYNRPITELSWAENATLAVLPNNPSVLFPGRNDNQLLEKRNRLLQKLLAHQEIDSLTYELSIEESLPGKPFALPQVAPHLLQKVNQQYRGEKVQTTIDETTQRRANEIVKTHYQPLQQNQIHNIAVIIIDNQTREVVSYIGNSPTDSEHQKDVNIIHRPRSTGSIMKPFLYAAMLDAGVIFPHTLVADVPTQIGNYIPENYNRKYSGAVPASVALAKSLNVPAVRMLQDFGVESLYHYLQKMELKDIDKGPEHYGLSLILGGAESNLWDLTKSYAAMSGTLTHYVENSSQYFSNEFCEPTFIIEEKIDFGQKKFDKNVFNAAAIYSAFESMKTVNRPSGEDNWEFYDSSKEIAWKTGTSFGFRDAWAIGTTKDFTIGVWVGNADGEGRPGLVGVQAAAPILFDLFDIVPHSSWFEIPYDDMIQKKLCVQSGHVASPDCDQFTMEYVPNTENHTSPCPYHEIIHVDQSGQYRVNSSCEKVGSFESKSWFVLPPLQSFYYQKENPNYIKLPPLRKDCIGSSHANMEFIYPKEQSNKIFLPKGFNGEKNEFILKVAHEKPESTIFWYLDNQYVASTTDIHEYAMLTSPGHHHITLVDDKGSKISRSIEIVN